MIQKNLYVLIFISKYLLKRFKTEGVSIKVTIDFQQFHFLF